MSATTPIRWVSAVIDRPAHQLDVAAAFWATVSGTTVRPQQHDRYLDLHDGEADDWLLLQGVLAGPGGAHLDLSVDDVAAFTRRAVALGATVTADHGSWRVLASVCGLPFCVAPWKGEHRRPRPFRRPDGGFSRVHQVCVDIAPAEFDAEVAFWAELTGWPLDTDGLPVFSRLLPPRPTPIRILLQRLDEPRPVSAHIDVSSTRIRAAQAWHEGLGATFVGEWPHWTTLRDPTGAAYCLTRGDPAVD